MGRHDSYSYYSEAGQAASGETPGTHPDRVRVEDKEECEMCGDLQGTVVERKGDLAGSQLCDQCAEEKQAESDRERAKAVFDDL